MTTRININLEGFDALSLRQRAILEASQNRQRKEEADRLELTRKHALLAREAELAKKGSPSETLGEALGNRRRRDISTDEYVPPIFKRFNVAQGYLEFQYTTQPRSTDDYRIYCGNASKYLEVKIPRATYEYPPLKYGNTSYTTAANFPPQIWTDASFGSTVWNPPLETLFNQPTGPQAGTTTSGRWLKQQDYYYPNGTLQNTVNYDQDIAVWAKLFPIGKPLLKPNRTRVELFQHSDFSYHCFPVNSERFILWMGSYDYKFTRYYGYQLDFTKQFNHAQDFIYTNTDQFGYTVVETYIDTAMSTIYEVVDSFDIVTPSQEVHEYCFLVGENDVKQIPVPAQLSAKMKALHAGMDQTKKPNILDLDLVITKPSQVCDNIIAFNSGDPQDPNDYSLSVTAENCRNVSDTSRTGWTNYITNKKYEPTIEYRLAQQFGMGSITVNLGSHVSQSRPEYTPSIYSMIDNAEAVRLETNQNLYKSYAYILNTYVLGTPFPKIFLETGADYSIQFPRPNGPPVYRKYYNYTQIMPQNINQILPLGVLRKNRATPKGIYRDISTELKAWDWGAPGYCRISCLLLGFPQSSLTFE